MRLTVCVAAIVLSAFQASASTLNFDSVDGVKDSSGNFVSPYNGRLDGIAYKLYCDDLLHDINIPDTETVNISSLGDLSKTRFGGLSGSTNLYEQIFYLSTFLPGATNAQRGNIQDAIWSYFSTSAPDQSNPAVIGWKTQASQNFAGKDYSSFRILTEANSAANPTAQFNGKQELFISVATTLPPGLTSTPEPGTWALLLSGFGGLAVSRFRRRNSAN